MKDFKEFNVELDEEHSAGDSVWAKDQTNKAKTNTGIITKVGRTMVHVKHKDGTTAQYPHKDVASEYSTLRPAMKEEVELDEAAKGHTIEAHGIRGMKRTAWRKTFKSHEHLSKWADANDSVEVHATRDLEQAKKGNLSPVIKEEAELDEVFADQGSGSTAKDNAEYMKRRKAAGATKHKVSVTVSEKDHPMVSKRLEKQQKFVKVSAGSKEEAVTKAKKFYTKQGYHVHDAEHHSIVSEEVKSTSIPSFKEFIE